MCPTSAAGPAVPTSTAVLLFSAVCPPGVLLETCIPYCDETTNGDVLLLQQAGNDMRLLCEMNNYFFSWIGAPSFSNSFSSPRPHMRDIQRLTRAGLCAAGAAGLGGFLGENVLAFVPAVISGAAGVYALTLMVDALNKADLTIQPGQVSGPAGMQTICPGRKPPFLHVKRPARPHKSAIENRLT
jgi:hypothetical protein